MYEKMHQIFQLVVALTLKIQVTTVEQIGWVTEKLLKIIKELLDDWERKIILKSKHQSLSSTPNNLTPCWYFSGHLMRKRLKPNTFSVTLVKLFHFNPNLNFYKPIFKGTSLQTQHRQLEKIYFLSRS